MKHEIKIIFIGTVFFMALAVSMLFVGMRARAETIQTYPNLPDLITLDPEERAFRRDAEPYYENARWYSEDEYILLAALIYAEAGDQDFDGKRLVADVVLNRVSSPEWPNTIAGVIFQEGQFSPVANGSLNRAFSLADQSCYDAAALALNGDRINTEVIYFSMYSCQNGVFAFQHGDHYFGY